MYDIPFDRSFLQLSNGIRHVMPSTDRKLELTAKASMAQPIPQPAVFCNGLCETDTLAPRTPNAASVHRDLIQMKLMMHLVSGYKVSLSLLAFPYTLDYTFCSAAQLINSITHGTPNVSITQSSSASHTRRYVH